MALDMHAEGQKATKGEATPEAIRKLSPVITRAADALEKLNPPADVRPYHEALVKAARASAAQLAAYQGGTATHSRLWNSGISRLR